MKLKTGLLSIILIINQMQLNAIPHNKDNFKQTSLNKALSWLGIGALARAKNYAHAVAQGTDPVTFLPDTLEDLTIPEREIACNTFLQTLENEGLNTTTINKKQNQQEIAQFMQVVNESLPEEEQLILVQRESDEFEFEILSSRQVGRLKKLTYGTITAYKKPRDASQVLTKQAESFNKESKAQQQQLIEEAKTSTVYQNLKDLWDDLFKKNKKYSPKVSEKYLSPIAKKT